MMIQKSLLVAVLLPLLLGACSWSDGDAPQATAKPARSVQLANSIAPAGADWAAYGGNAGHQQYSALSQINVDNVFELKPAWQYRSARGTAPVTGSELQVNPLVISGVLYGIAPDHSVFALNAASGNEKWRIDPAGILRERGLNGGDLNPAASPKRGFARWTNGRSQRLFFGVGPYLFAIDAADGGLVESFGDDGIIDLREGLDRPASSVLLSGSTPGAVYQNLLIVGSRVGSEPGAAPADVRAYDVSSGEIRWTFHTIPLNGQHGSDSWPADARDSIGGADVRAGISVDAKRGLAFLAVGSPAGGFIGVDRPGNNLYANSVVALQAGTGAVKWHYQIVRHDLWGRGLNSAPTLVTVKVNGKPVDAVAQTTKHGYVYVFKRDTGESLFPITETEAPASTLQQEQTAATQPLPQSPPAFAKQGFDETDLTDISPEAHAHTLALYRNSDPALSFMPFGSKPRIMMPGTDGGATWGGPAWSPGHGLLIINAQNQPMIGQIASGPPDNSQGAMVYNSACAGCHGADRAGIDGTGPPLLNLKTKFKEQQLREIIVKGRGTMLGMPLPEQFFSPLIEYLYEAPATTPATDTTPAFTGPTRFTDHEGYPAVKPPWGTLTAIDLNRGRFAWQTILGEHEALRQRGLPPTGTLNYGGPVTTAGGLVFIAATMDSRIRAFDLQTGEELWQAALPAPAYSTPAVYSVAGKQYIVVACGGGKLDTPSSDIYMAFALPEPDSEDQEE